MMLYIRKWLYQKGIIDYQTFKSVCHSSLSCYHRYFSWKSTNGKSLLEGCSRILFISEFVEKFKSNRNKMNIFLTAIDISRVHLNNFEVIRINVRNNKYGIQKEDKVASLVDKTIGNKGVLELIQAFNHCKFQDDMRLVVGETYNFNKVIDYVKKYLLKTRKNHNILLTGYIFYLDISNYYIVSDIAILLLRCNGT